MQRSVPSAQLSSLIDILKKKGFIDSNEHGFYGDIKLALRDVKGEHDNVCVMFDVDLDGASVEAQQAIQSGIDKLTAEIKKLIGVAGNPRNLQNKRLLIPLNNGGNHFVVLDIVIEHGGSINVTLIDSMQENKASDQHKKFNNDILNRAVNAAIHQASLNLASVPSRNKVTSSTYYSSEQNNTADCPFHVIQFILKTCSNEKTKLAILKDLAKAKGESDDFVNQIKIDHDLKIVYDANNKAFLKQKPELLKARSNDLSPEARRIYESVKSYYIQSEEERVKTEAVIKRDLDDDRYKIYQNLKLAIDAKTEEAGSIYEALAKADCEALAKKQREYLKQLSTFKSHVKQVTWKEKFSAVTKVDKDKAAADTVEYSGPNGERVLVSKKEQEDLDRVLAEELNGKSEKEVESYFKAQKLSR